MASKKLTSDEVNALMEGLNEASSPVGIDMSQSDEVRPFAFGEDDLSLMGDYYALRLINERFARQARTVFLPMLRLQPRITPFAPEVKTFDEYCASIDTFMNLNINRIDELRGTMLMTIQPKFISTLTASFYGGTLDGAVSKRTEFTSTEERVIELVSDGLNAALAHSWRDLMAISLIEQGREVNTQFASVVDGSELVIICSFMVQLPNAEADTIDIVYPLQTLKPIASLLRSRVQSDVVDDDTSWKERLEKSVLNVPLPISAILSEPSVPLSNLLKYKPGDVVNLPPVDGIDFFVDDKLLFKADIGETNGQVAVSLKNKV